MFLPVKRLGSLTLEDLAASPVWRYESGEGAETVVVAEKRDALSRFDEEIFLAASEFDLPDSSRFMGFCFPADDAGLEYLQPVIVMPAGHVRFWFEGDVAPEFLSCQWRVLGKQDEEVFPVRVRCLVPVDGAMVTAVISAVETPAGVLPTQPTAPAATVSGVGSEAPGPPRPRAPASGSRKSRARRLFTTPAGLLRKRTAPRRRVEMAVDFDQEGAQGTGVTGDISGSGLFVRASQLPSVGPALNLTLSLPGGRKVQLRGRVVRSGVAFLPARAFGFGLSLTDKPDEYDDFLAGLFEDH